MAQSSNWRPSSQDYTSDLHTMLSHWSQESLFVRILFLSVAFVNYLHTNIERTNFALIFRQNERPFCTFQKSTNWRNLIPFLLACIFFLILPVFTN